MVGNGVMLAGSWCPAATRARSTARVPTRSISRSVAMLSLVAIIFSAALRTDTWAPSGSSSSPDDPTTLARPVMVSGSSQDTVPAFTSLATASSTYSLKIEASGRDWRALVAATGLHTPPSMRAAW